MAMKQESLADERPALSIRCNGAELALEHQTTLLELLERLGRDARTVAVEYNGEILPRSRFRETHLADGDRLEIVQFVQGG